MKKSLFVIAILVLFSCSASKEDTDTKITTNFFNPPSWIQGSWGYGLGEFTFKKNDYCSKLLNSETCYNDLFNVSTNGGVLVDVKEDISETEYKFSFTIQGQTTYYDFKKISSTKIELINSIKGQPSTILTKI